jgi:hypothetical protein
MLWTIFVILLVLWLLGVVSSYTIGGFIHLLLVLALVVLIINIIGGRRPVVLANYTLFALLDARPHRKSRWHCRASLISGKW